MKDIDGNQAENKAWRKCKRVVLHAACGEIHVDIGETELIEDLLDRENFPNLEPWVPVIHRDTLHLLHPIFTACGGEA